MADKEAIVNPNYARNTLAKQCRESIPKLFKLAYPRNITSPEGYAPSELLGGVICGHINAVNDPRMAHRAHNISYGASMGLIANRVPMYFVADEFARAAANTDLPGDFKFLELKWPLSAQTFVLSDRFCLEYYGHLSPFLSVVKLEKGLYPESLPRAIPPTEIRYPGFFLDADQIMFDCPVFTKDSTITYNGCYPMTDGVEHFSEYVWHDATTLEEQLYPFIGDVEDVMTKKEEEVFCTKAQTLAIKLLLIIAEMPSLVEHGKVTRHAKIDQATKRVLAPELVSPNIVGRTYRIPRRYAQGAATGSRAKPKFKYRRGHHAWVAKKTKAIEFISVEAMPRTDKGFIDFNAAGPDKTAKFHACHERQWIEGFLFEDEDSTEGANQGQNPAK